jgi:hypothetical protein
MEAIEMHRRLLIFVSFVLISLKTIDCLAISAPGYIVSLQSDTIYGWVQLSQFDQMTGGLVLKGIEEESFHSRVVFIPKGRKRFKTYFPEMLSGFGFKYNSTDYIYQQIIVQRKSIFKSETQQYRFVRLVYEGNDGVRYKDVQMIPNPGLQLNEDEYIKYNTNFLRINRSTKQTEQNNTN